MPSLVTGPVAAVGAGLARITEWATARKARLRPQRLLFGTIRERRENREGCEAGSRGLPKRERVTLVPAAASSADRETIAVRAIETGISETADGATEGRRET